MLNPSENPPMLSPGARAVGELLGQWWVAHTKPRFEKSLAWDLGERQVGYFLPMVERVTYSGGRKRHVRLPLFSSYLFFCGTEEARRAALRTDRVCRVIPVVEQQRLRDELSQLERALAAKAPLGLFLATAVGRRCRVRAGPFAGVEGVVSERMGVSRLVLQVSMLGQAVALDIERDLLEAVN